MQFFIAMACQYFHMRQSWIEIEHYSASVKN